MTAFTFQQTHICVVLDRSGSMDACRQQTVDALNRYIHEARGDQYLKESDFACLQFDTQSIDQINRFTGAPCNMPDLTLDDFVPRGGTPLYDAIGRGITHLDGKLAASKSTKAILMMLTDGQENASRKHTHESISGLIKSKQDAGWLVVFLGAGLDVAKIGFDLGVRAAYAASVATQDAASMQSVGGAIAHSSMGYAANATGAEAKQWMTTGGGVQGFTPESRLRMNAGKPADLTPPINVLPIGQGPLPAAFQRAEDIWGQHNDKASQSDAWGQ